MPKHYPTLAGLDIGSNKVCCAIAEMTPEGLEVIGFGQAESVGVRKGVVVNIDATVHALEQAIKETMHAAQREIDYLAVGVTGSHIQGIASHGMVPIRDQEVSPQDIHRVIEAASAVTIPLDREVI